MRINLNVSEWTQNCQSYVKKALSQINAKIQEIWTHIQLAYYETSKEIDPIKLLPHPITNTYPQEHKKKNWPAYLNHAWGKWGHADDLEKFAQSKDPLEHVTPLHATTLGSNYTGMYRLIAHNAIVDAKDIRGQIPAYWAAYHGNLKALMILSIYGANLNQADYRGKTPLRAAAKYGHIDEITFLAAQRVDLDALDGRGLTALHVAAYNKRFDVYEKLIYFGADRSIKDPLGRTAEDILKLRCAKAFHNRWFIGRLFSSPNPPPLSIKKWDIDSTQLFKDV